MQDMTQIIELLRKLGHDMRVPLNTLISTSDMLEQGIYDPLTARQQKAVARLQRNSQRLVAMLDDFITYFKADTGSIELHPQPFDPRSCLEDSSQCIRAVIEEKDVTLTIITDDTVPEILRGDESIIDRILQALLWNAASFTYEGEIQVTSTYTSDQKWIVSIMDTGPGIEKADLPYIFEPFWRGIARPYTLTAGAGLGLPMALALAKLMNGKVSLSQTTPEGCEFCIELEIPPGTLNA